MDPRTSPQRANVTTEAVEETRQYGAMQRYKPGVAAAYTYWKEVAAQGLPSGQREYRRVTTLDGDERLEWKVYVVTVESIRVGIAETLDGDTLWLLLIVPANLMSPRAAFDTARERL
jgi:hypothetical protein